MSGRGALWAGKWLAMLALAVVAPLLNAQETTAAQGAGAAPQRPDPPPRVVEAARFLAQRGWTPGRAAAGRLRRHASIAATQPQAQTPGSATWQPLGPTAVQSENFGLVTGRVSALALDPSDSTGNTLYVGTTGGGVWRSQNAGSPANVPFIPLTDDLSALSNAQDASISIGALIVLPGEPEVILAGTGDPNDTLDSYYGAGILRSTDGGNTWSLISTTADQLYSFAGEGFAGFARGTVNQQPVVVAAVSQAYEGTLVNAVESGSSYQGLYYSLDGGAHWSLATITDGAGEVVQGTGYNFALPDGNAATSVVWNPVRNLFVAAVRYHGYYQSSDGKTFTRMASQPGAGLTGQFCRTNPGKTGSPGCPIFRGTLAVNPETGDTFAWTVDIANQDQGIWQDVCAASGGACTNLTIAFGTQWNTAALEKNPPLDTSIANGDYNLTLAAIPSGQTTILLAGANDLWKCSLAQGCTWRNTTNSTAGFCAQVGEYQHALAWDANNPLEIFVGNDSGLWRSLDAIGESGPVCGSASNTDSSHFQNLNGSLGSLAEVVSLSQAGTTPYAMMAGLGENGTAGVNSTAGPTTDWPEILGGAGGPVAIDPKTPSNWYANNGPGVSIYLGEPPTGSTPGAFNPVLNFTTDPGATAPLAPGAVAIADVVRDGLSMAVEPPYAPASFLVDPLDSAQLLIGTCRVWRGPASGVGWSAANAISYILDGMTGENDCAGNALIRSMAAMALPVSTALTSGGEVVYVGIYGGANGGGTLPGHVLRATYNSATGSWSAWSDVTALNPVANDTDTMNAFGLDISSVFIDPHDPSGETVYVTVAGIPTLSENVQEVYGSTDGGVHWTDWTSNLPAAPANSLVVDPQDANTVYVATDAGVYSARQIANCASESPGCWSAFGSGLPEAPVVALSAAPASAAVHDLVAATYGRGIWMTPLLGASGAGSGPATDTLSVTSLSFSDTVIGQLSAVQSVTLTNSGGAALTSIAVSVSGAFVIGESPRQTNISSPCTATLAPGGSCSINAQFYPNAAGAQIGALTVSDALHTQTVTLAGTGLNPPVLGVSPSSLSFTGQQVSVASSPQTLTLSNTGGAPLANAGFQITGISATSFSTGPATCGTTLSNVSGQNSCTVQVVFTPTAAGGSTASLVVSSSTTGVAAVSVPLTGTGKNPAGLNVNPAQLAFPLVAPGQSSPPQTVNLTNTGGATANPLNLSVTSPFRLTQNTCGASLAAGASCTIGVVFSPVLDGNFTGTLTIASPAQTPAIVLLSGMGEAPGSIQAQPSQISFPQTGVGLLSTPVPVTLTNPNGNPSLTNFTLAAPIGFQLVNNACPSTLAAGASCTADVEFAPTRAGQLSGSLTVGSSALATGAFVPLSGMGFDFTICGGIGLPCAPPSSQTIANGQTANFNLVITPLNGSQGAFTFQCGSLPAYSSCTFNPSSESVPAGTTGYETVEIATGLSSSSARLSRPPAWPVLSLACGLLLAPFASIVRARRRKALLLIALLAILAGGVSSCTSSGIISGGNIPHPGLGITPAKTYSIPVTATSNGVSRSITLTLTVD